MVAIGWIVFLCHSLCSMVCVNSEKETETSPACSVGIILSLNLNEAKAGEYLLPAHSQLRYAMLWTRSDGA